MDLHANSVPIIYELAPKTSLPRWSDFFSTLSFSSTLLKDLKQRNTIMSFVSNSNLYYLFDEALVNSPPPSQ